MSIKEKAKFSAALLVAALWSIATPVTSFRRVWRAFVLWFGFIGRGGKASMELAENRLAVCRGCPIFYAPLETCGTPLTKGLRGLGCYCYMPAKTQLADAGCWLDEEAERGHPGGWIDAGLKPE